MMALVLAGWMGGVANLQGAGRVELVVVGQSQAGGEFQQWLRTLGQVGAASVQIRASQPSDRVGIEISGTGERPVYVVTAMLSSQNELVVPGARFRQSDSRRLAEWIKDLAENGPPERREARSAFGLTATQLQQVRDDLARPVGFATKGMARNQVVEQIGQRLKRPLRIDRAAQQSLADDKVVEELSTLSCGTALACVVRPAGLCLVPQAAGNEVVYTIVSAQAGGEIWPIGWKPEKQAREVLPALFEFLTVNIQDVSAAKAMEAIGARLKVPLLVDHNALARHGIEPDKVNVSVPRGKTTHSLVLQKILFQARLKSELRVDEAGTPFLWITSIKPL